MPDPTPLQGQMFRIGKQTRKFMFPYGAIALVHEKFPGQSAQDVINGLNPHTLPIVAAAGLLGGGKPVSPEKVKAWLTAEPRLYIPLSKVVIETFGEGYKLFIPKEEEAEDDEEGEAGAPAETTGA